MTRLKYLVLGLVIGGLFGLWFGVNLGKGNPVYANPFHEPDVTQRLKSGAEEVLEEGRRSLRQALD